MTFFIDLIDLSLMALASTLYTTGNSDKYIY